jgi:T-complex protein 1 subunit theta
MSLKVPKSNNLPIFKDGYKYLQGLDEAILRNIEAVVELSDLVRTSFGPNGKKSNLQDYVQLTLKTRTE